MFNCYYVSNIVVLLQLVCSNDVVYIPIIHEPKETSVKTRLNYFIVPTCVNCRSSSMLGCIDCRYEFNMLKYIIPLSFYVYDIMWEKNTT